MKYGFKCPKCDSVLDYGLDRCPHCNVRLDWTNIPKPEEVTPEKNFAFNDFKYPYPDPVEEEKELQKAKEGPIEEGKEEPTVEVLKETPAPFVEKEPVKEEEKPVEEVPQMVEEVKVANPEVVSKIKKYNHKCIIFSLIALIVYISIFGLMSFTVINVGTKLNGYDVLRLIFKGGLVTNDLLIAGIVPATAWALSAILGAIYLAFFISSCLHFSEEKKGYKSAVSAWNTIKSCIICLIGIAEIVITSLFSLGIVGTKTVWVEFGMYIPGIVLIVGSIFTFIYNIYRNKRDYYPLKDRDNLGQ